MYLAESFSSGAFKKATFIDAGCYASVFQLEDPRWVVKYAANDGTLNYLEWCVHMQKTGKRMIGMPRVDILIKLPDSEKYIVTMQRYESARDRLEKVQREANWDSSLVSALKSQKHPYISVLIGAYEEYARKYLGLSQFDLGEDIHRGNIMWDVSNNCFILTDPYAGAYVTQPPELELV